MRRVLCVIAAVVCASTAFAQKQGKEVRIAGDDGFRLRGVYYAPGKTGPAILLLHQCDREGMLTGYEKLAALFVERGFHVLTLDFRGYGGSADEKRAGGDRQTLSQHIQNDVEAAFQFLSSQRGVTKGQIGAAGASCGGRQAILLAARHPEVKALALISSSFRSPADTAYQQIVHLPVLSITSEDDGNATQAMKRTFEMSKHKDSQLLMYKGQGHGTPLFAQDPLLESKIVEWFRSRLTGGQ